MVKLKITLGVFETDDPDGFEKELLNVLNAWGKISDIEGKGLTLSRIGLQGRPGMIGRAVMDILIARPHSSPRSINARLPDFTWKQMESALRRLYKNGEIVSKRERKGNATIWYYSATEKGIEKHEAMDEAEERAKPNALLVWNTCRALGWGEHSQLDLELLGERSGLTGVQLRFALKYLTDRERMVKKWNEEEQSSEYFIARRKE